MKIGSLVVLALLAGTLLWLLLSPHATESAEPAQPHIAAPDSAGRGRAAADLAAREQIGPGEARAEAARREAITAAPPPDEVAAATQLPAQGELATLHVRVQDDRTGEAAGGLPVRVYTVRDDEGSRRSFKEWLASQGWGEFKEAEDGPDFAWNEEVARTDEFGCIRFELPAGAPYSVRAGDQEYDTDRVFKHIEALRPSELHELILELRRGPDFVFHGRLVSAADGSPIAGAPILAFDARPSAENEFLILYPAAEWRKDARLSLIETTDAQGYFSLEGRSWDWSRGVAAVPHGHAPVFAALEEECDSRANACTLRAPAAARLSGRVTGSTGPGRVVVFAPCRRLKVAGAGSWNEPAAWVAEWDARGDYRIEGLSPGVPLEVELQPGPGQRVAVATSLRLKPGEGALRNWSLDEAATIAGVVVDESSQPVAGAPVAAISRPYPTTWREGAAVPMPERSSDEAAARARTDESGRFVLTGLPEGRWAVGVNPYDDEETLEVSRGGILVELPHGADERHVTVQVFRRLFVGGRVLLPDGEPAAAAYVSVTGPERDTYRTRSDDEGRFRLGPVGQGTYRINAWHPAKLVEFRTQTAEAGETDVLLIGQTASGILVSVRNADGSLPDQIDIHLRGDQGGRMTWSMGAYGEPDLELSPLEPGTYDLYLESDVGDVALLHQQRVPPGSLTRLPDVRLSSSGAVELALPPSANSLRFEIRSGGSEIPLDDFLGEEMLIRLPPGRYELTVHYEIEGEAHSQALPIEVHVGQRTTVEVAPPPPRELENGASPENG